MSSEKILQVYEKIVYWVADTAPDNWHKVEINMEMAIDGEEVANSCVLRAFVGPELKKMRYDASANDTDLMIDLFILLNDLAAESGDRWSICDFVVDNKGKYNVDYSFDTPPRLNGDIAAGTQ